MDNAKEITEDLINLILKKQLKLVKVESKYDFDKILNYFVGIRSHNCELCEVVPDESFGHISQKEYEALTFPLILEFDTKDRYYEATYESKLPTDYEICIPTSSDTRKTYSRFAYGIKIRIKQIVKDSKWFIDTMIEKSCSQEIYEYKKKLQDE